MARVKKDSPQQEDTVIVVENARQKKLAEPQLSQRRVIKDTKFKKKEEEVHFNMGFMPGNSFRCTKCRNGFALPHGAEEKCPNCKSKKLVPHSTDIIA